MRPQVLLCTTRDRCSILLGVVTPRKWCGILISGVGSTCGPSESGGYHQPRRGSAALYLRLTTEGRILSQGNLVPGDSYVGNGFVRGTLFRVVALLLLGTCSVARAVVSPPFLPSVISHVAYRDAAADRRADVSQTDSFGLLRDIRIPGTYPPGLLFPLQLSCPTGDVSCVPLLCSLGSIL